MGAIVITYSWRLKTEGSQELRIRRRNKFHMSLLAQYRIIHRFYPPKYFHRHCFRFPLGHLHVPGEIENNDYAKFLGVKEVYYGICASRQ